MLYGGDGRQLSIQLLGALVIAAWTCVINYILFSFLASHGKLRVAAAEELQGLNASIHGIPDKNRSSELPRDYDAVFTGTLTMGEETPLP